MLDSIKDSFTESIQIQIAAAEALPDAITHAAQAMVTSLLNGNKILCCGNGAPRLMHSNLYPAYSTVSKRKGQAYQPWR